MYIKTTENVEKIFQILQTKNLNYKLKFLLYVFDSIYQNKIQDQKRCFMFSKIGIPNEICMVFVEYLLVIYNRIFHSNCVYQDHQIIGMHYDKSMIKMFEELTFLEKLDIISELIIEYDFDQYFEEKISIVTFGEESGMDIANKIQNQNFDIL